MVSPEFPQNVICPFIKFILRRDIFHKNFPKTMTLIRQKEPQREPQKEAKKTKWEWLKKVGDNILRIIGALALIFAVIKGGSELKDILWGQPKPQLLRAENCKFYPDYRQIEFELLVNNPRSIDISMISFNLILWDSFEADLHFPINLHNVNDSPSMPLTIPSGQTLRVRSFGDFEKYDNDKEFRKKWELQKDQKTIEGTLVAEFNTNDVRRKIINFTNVR